MTSNNESLLSRQSPEWHLKVIKSLSDYAPDVIHLLDPISEAFHKSKAKFVQTQDHYIPILQEMIDNPDEEIGEGSKFAAEHDDFKKMIRPFDIQCRGLSISLIMTISGEVKRVADLCSKIFKIYGKQWDMFKVYELSPNVRQTTWAEGVVAASNYVRHEDEWHLLPVTRTEDGKFRGLDALRALEDNKNFRAIKNLKTLKLLGIQPERIVFEQADVSTELVEILNLDSSSSVVQIIQEWSAQLYKKALKVIKL